MRRGRARAPLEIRPQPGPGPVDVADVVDGLPADAPRGDALDIPEPQVRVEFPARRLGAKFRDPRRGRRCRKPMRTGSCPVRSWVPGRSSGRARNAGTCCPRECVFSTMEMSGISTLLSAAVLGKYLHDADSALVADRALVEPRFLIRLGHDEQPVESVAAGVFQDERGGLAEPLQFLIGHVPGERTGHPGWCERPKPGNRAPRPLPRYRPRGPASPAARPRREGTRVPGQRAGSVVTGGSCMRISAQSCFIGPFERPRVRVRLTRYVRNLTRYCRSPPPQPPPALHGGCRNSAGS